MNWRQYFSLMVCAAVMSACSNTSTENVTTEGISADIEVFANDSGSTVVTAQLEVGNGVGGTSLELGPNDRNAAPRVAE